MIDRNLDPIRLGQATDWGEILQALMFSYLARYNDLGADVNTQQAYRRAWGVTEMQFFARTGNELGFMVARIPYTWGDHLIIAVEGTTNSSQLWSFRNGVDGAQIPPAQTGYVWGNEVTRSNSIWTRLTASAWFMGLATQRTTYLTFTGHSQGASMAAILGGRWKATQAHRGVVVRMFGSPRFATQGYIDRYNPQIQMTSFHTRRDPISLIPGGGVCNEALDALALPIFWNVSFQLFPGTWIDEFGNQSSPELHEAGWSAADAYISILGNNPRWPNCLPFHFMWTYRMAAMNIAHRAGGLLALRVNYLEHPDENQWQVQFRPGTIMTPAWQNLATPAPAPFTDLEPEQIRLHNAGVPQNAITPEPDNGIGASGGGDLEDWGNVPAIISLRRRRLQHNPVVVTP